MGGRWGEVISDGRVQLTGDHGDLEINPVVLTDAGEYTCVAVTSDTQLTLGSYLETVIGSTGLIIASEIMCLFSIMTADFILFFSCTRKAV